MGQAREVMDRITAAVVSADRDTLLRLYAIDAVVEAPDSPRVEGSAAIADYLLALAAAFPDASWEALATHESDGIAIDEGFFVGTHTGVLSTPEGDLPPTGRRLRLRECDVLVVDNGVAVAHRFYYDQLQFLEQLGLAEPAAGTGEVPQPRSAAESAERTTTG